MRTIDTSKHRRRIARILAALSLSTGGCKAWAPPLKWNVTQIAWEANYEAGVARAKAERRPILVTFYADWCEPCQEFHHVFEDPRVIEAAKDFVVIHVNVDKREDLSAKFHLGGDFLPRTYFFTPDGVLLKGVHAPDLKERFNYDHKDPAPLLAAMLAARSFARDPGAPGEDPSAVTAAQVCAPKAGQTACAACRREHCCAERVAWVDRAEGAPLTACSAAHCAEPCRQPSP